MAGEAILGYMKSMQRQSFDVKTRMNGEQRVVSFNESQSKEQRLKIDLEKASLAELRNYSRLLDEKMKRMDGSRDIRESGNFEESSDYLLDCAKFIKECKEDKEKKKKEKTDSAYDVIKSKLNVDIKKASLSELKKVSDLLDLQLSQMNVAANPENSQIFSEVEKQLAFHRKAFDSKEKRKRKKSLSPSPPPKIAKVKR